MNLKCPKCNSEKVIPIVYGPPPTEDMRERPSTSSGQATARGKIKLGGCVIGDDPPLLHCSDCQHDWR
jgi:hypothetical protein